MDSQSLIRTPMELEVLGLCIRTPYYVATSGGELREKNYVISPEVFEFLVEHCPEEAFTITPEEYDKIRIHGVLSYFIPISRFGSEGFRDQLWEKLIKAELEEEKIKEVINQMAEKGITSEYRGFQSSEAPFSVKDEHGYKDWLEKELIAPVIRALLDKGSIPPLPPSPPPPSIILLGTDKPTPQWGIIGKISEKKVLIDHNEPHTISIFGIQGSGKSYTPGVITEMAVKAAQNIAKLDKPLASVIFHYSKKETYTPEFESLTRPNRNQEDINELRGLYKAEPMAIQNIKILLPPAKLVIRKEQYEGLEVEPLLFRPQELGALEWSLLLDAGGEQLYLKKINEFTRMVETYPGRKYRFEKVKIRGFKLFEEW